MLSDTTCTHMMRHDHICWWGEKMPMVLWDRVVCVCVCVRLFPYAPDCPPNPLTNLFCHPCSSSPSILPGFVGQSRGIMTYKLAASPHQHSKAGSFLYSWKGFCDSCETGATGRIVSLVDQPVRFRLIMRGETIKIANYMRWNSGNKCQSINYTTASLC